MKHFLFILKLFFFSVLYISSVLSQNPTVSTSEYPGIELTGLRWATENLAYLQTSENTVYKSSNGGIDWTQLTNLDGAATYLYISPADPSYKVTFAEKVLFSGSNLLWSTQNALGATTYEKIDTPGNFYYIKMHPTQKTWFLAQTLPSCAVCSSSLYFTSDFGKTFILVTEKLYKTYFTWGHTGSVPESRFIYITQANIGINSGSGTLKYIDWKDVQKNPANPEESAISVMDSVFGYIWRPKHLLVGVNGGTTIDLYVAQDIPGKGVAFDQFNLALWPHKGELNNNAYSILDDSTGAVWIGINHGNGRSHWGNLYTSGSQGYKFILEQEHTSIEYGAWDFGSVEGLEGIYISNNVSNWQIAEGNKNNNDLVESFITFDNGGIWNYLIPPTVDSQGNQIICTGKCHLHLHGFSSFDNDIGPFYSRESALGLIIGTGNIGDYLSYDVADLSTYLSTDAGTQWIELFKGNSIYEYGDHGGIIVISPFGVKTDTIYYTADEGKTVVPWKIADYDIIVDNIITEPSNKGNKFVLYGRKYEDTGNDEAIIMGLDFSTLHERTCVDADYYYWSPLQSRTDECLLGKKITYKRKIPSAVCFNPTDKIAIVSTVNCECSYQDYECDYGDTRKYIDGESECLGKSISDSPPSPCPSGSTYEESQGYRKVAGDTCTGGLDLNPKTKDCPKYVPSTSSTKGGSNSWVAAVVILLILGIAILVFVVAVRNDEIREKMPEFVKNNVPSFLISSSATGYKPHNINDDNSLGIAVEEDEETAVPEGVLEDEDSESNEEGPLI